MGLIAEQKLAGNRRIFLEFFKNPFFAVQIMNFRNEKRFVSIKLSKKRLLRKVSLLGSPVRIKLIFFSEVLCIFAILLFYDFLR